MSDPQAGGQTVTTAGIPEPLSRVPQFVARLDIWALDGNTDRIYVGDHAVSAVAGNQRGGPLSALEQMPFEDVDLGNIWIDAAASGEGVTWIARLAPESFTTAL